MKTYIFQPKEGQAGIPGLPHEITEEEAERLGVSKLLKEAVKAGQYVEKPSKNKEK